jgi:hypothetical protein
MLSLLAAIFMVRWACLAITVVFDGFAPAEVKLRLAWDVFEVVAICVRF